MTKRITILFLLFVAVLAAAAQGRKVQHKPYVDLRPLHFGISIGAHVQDMEVRNIGPQIVTIEDEDVTRTVVSDVDTWNPGLSVGVLADLRLGQHLALRVSPTMHFGSKHLVFRDFQDLNDAGHPRESTQDMKNTYLSVPIDLKFSAQRFNNYRPYLIAGASPMLNLTGKDQDYVHLNRFDTMLEVGLGCDFYLPFFKLIPELKFCYSLGNTLNSKHAAELTDVNKRVFSNAIDLAQSKMIVLTFYFE